MRTSMNSVLDGIGWTPMILMNNMPKKEGLKSQIFAKCDFQSIGGSVKDRIGMNMIVQAEKREEIKKGDYIVESTSGNTGIGLALTSMVMGYKTIITIPDKMSTEKVNLLKSLGAEVHICDTNAPKGHPDKYYYIHWFYIINLTVFESFNSFLIFFN